MLIDYGSFSRVAFFIVIIAGYFLLPHFHSAFSPFFQHIRINKMVKNKIYGINHIWALEESDRITLPMVMSNT